MFLALSLCAQNPPSDLILRSDQRRCFCGRAYAGLKSESVRIPLFNPKWAQIRTVPPCFRILVSLGRSGVGLYGCAHTVQARVRDAVRGSRTVLVVDRVREERSKRGRRGARNGKANKKRNRACCLKFICCGPIDRPHPISLRAKKPAIGRLQPVGHSSV